MQSRIPLPGRDLPAGVWRQGEGAALVYLHGAFGLEWSMPLVQRLAQHHQVLAPHLPGYGESEGLERISSFYDLSVWIDEVLDAQQIEQVVLVGHDFGGAAAAEYAALFRRRVSRLVLLAPYGLWPEGDPLPDIFGLTPGALTRLLYADPMGPHAQDFNAQHPDKATQDAAILRRRQALIAAAKLLWPIPDKGLRHRLYRITAPALLIGGHQDQLFDRSYLERFAGMIGGAQLAMLDSGHMLPQEASAAADALIAHFITQGVI